MQNQNFIWTSKEVEKIERIVYVGFKFQFRNTEINPYLMDDKRIFLPLKLTPSSEFQKWTFYTEMPSKSDIENVLFDDEWKLKVYATYNDTRFVWKFFDKDAYNKFIEKTSKLSSDEIAFLIKLIYDRINFPFEFKPNGYTLRKLEYYGYVTIDGFIIEMVRLDFTDVINKLMEYYREYNEYTKLLIRTLDISWKFDDKPIYETLRNYIWSISQLDPEKAENLYLDLHNIVYTIEKYVDK